MYRTDGRRDEYDNTSEVLMGAKNVIRRMLEDENRAILACKQMHDYRLMQYHFGTGTAQRAVKILSPGLTINPTVYRLMVAYLSLLRLT